MANPKAIIADDEEQLRIYLRSKLSGLWPELDICAEAENGLKALELIDKNRPDIAFLDINMPGIDGLETTRRISQAYPETKVVIFSTYEANEYDSRARDAGAIAFVPKADFEPSVLTSTWELTA